MQDRYAGDIGDYGKIGLLRALEQAGFHIGVNWYKAAPSGVELNNQDGKHRIKEMFRECDTELADALLHIFDHERSIDALEQADLIPGAKYFHETVPQLDRGSWHLRALEKLKECDLVFLDPDNGILPKSVKPQSPKSIKYVLDEELKSYLEKTQSVVLYNHRPRRNANLYFDDLSARFKSLNANKIFSLTFPRGTVRDYIFFAANEQHTAAMQNAIERMLKSPWGKQNLCRRPEHEML